MQFDFNQTYKKLSKLLEAFDFDEIDNENDISHDIFDLKANLMNEDVWADRDIFDIDDLIEEMFKDKDTLKSALFWVGELTSFDAYEPIDADIYSNDCLAYLMLLEYDEFVNAVKEAESHGKEVPVEALCLAYALDGNYCGLEWCLEITGSYSSSYEEDDPEVGYWGGTSIESPDVSSVYVCGKDYRSKNAEIGGFDLVQTIRTLSKYSYNTKKIIPDDMKELYDIYDGMFSGIVLYYEDDIIKRIESYYD